MNIRLSGAWVCCILFSLVGRADTILYVNQSATGTTQNGQSWATAYHDLQPAIAAANPSSNNKVEIWIAKGTYKPTSGTDRSATFALKSYLRLLGGCNGTETTANIDSRNITGNVTVLSGDIGSPQSSTTQINHNNYHFQDVAFNETEPGYSDNSYNILTCSNAHDIVLEGLVIANGNANIGVTNLTMLDTNLTEDAIEQMSRPQAIDSGTVSTTGATLYPLDHRVAGGALFVQGPYTRPNSEVTMVLSFCWFVNNGARGYGGAVCVNEAQIQGAYCHFINNHAEHEGGAYWGLNQEGHFLYSEFNYNGTDGSGGAMVYQSIASDKMNFSTNCLSQTAPARKDIIKGVNAEYGVIKFSLDVANEATLAHKIYRAVSSLASSSSSTAESSISIESALNALKNVSAADVAAGVAAAYGVLTLVVSVTDLATAGMDDSNNADLRRWRTFSAGFNQYATPGGWATLLADQITSALGGGPTAQDKALSFKQAALCMYNPSSVIGDPSYSTIRACTFYGNSAAISGGAMEVLMDNIQVEACRFEQNAAGQSAGAISSGVWNTPILMSCVFYQNRCTNGTSALSNYSHSREQVFNCTIVGNHSDNTNGYALRMQTGSEVKIVNSILWSNSNPLNTTGNADIFCDVKSKLSTVQAATNVASARQNYDSSYGDGTYGNWIAICDLSHSDVQSLNLLPTNSDDNFDDIPLFTEHRTYSSAEITAIQQGLTNAEYHAALEGFGFINRGEGMRPGFKTSKFNISADPKLVNGYMLLGNSPCIDAGSTNKFNNHLNGVNSITGADVTVNERIVGASVDMGAVEYQGVPPQFNVYYVKQDATGDNSGRDWANAMTNLQTALSQPNVTVWVAAGTYHPASTSQSFNVGAGVQFYGGFSGTETSINQRDWKSHPTILSGDLGGGHYASCVLQMSAADPFTLVDGFTITKGRGYRGAGAYVRGGPAIQNCTFVDNAANSAGGQGGAMLITGTDSAMLTNCVFTANSADTAGGAVYSEAPVFVLNCKFVQNTSKSGGAVEFANATYGYLYNCLLVSNSIAGANTSYGGAIYSLQTDTGIYNCTLANNSAALNATSTRGGGGIDFNGNTSQLVIENSIFWRNSVSNPAGVSTIENRQIAVDAASGTFVDHSIIDGLSQYGSSNQHNLDTDPRFVSVGNGDFHLKSYSPAIDAGAGTSYGSDLDGNARVRNNAIDIGAYEFQDVPLTVSDNISMTRICDGSGGVQSLVLLTNFSGATVQWQVDDGTGFKTISNGGIYSGATTTNLIITHPPLTADGYHYRALATGANGVFTSDELTLTVSRSLFYVKTGATGTGDGSSWANAFTNLDAALDAAGPCSQIWVAKGTYYPNVNDGSIAYQMRSDVAIYGGFAGTETTLTQRSWRLNPTILSGNIGSATNSDDNSVHIIENNVPLTITPCGPTAILDGFVLSDAKGSAIFNRGASPTIRNCTFTNNVGAAGGAIWNQEGSSPYISECVFVNNTSGDGGAIYSVDSSPTVANSLFYQNRSTHRGGAVASFGGSFTALNCTIADNSAQNFAGGIYFQNGTNKVLNCILWNNAEGRPYSTLLTANLTSDYVNPSVSNSCWQGTTTTSSGNFGFDPLFVNETGADFRLQAYSSSVNAGNSSYATGLATDLAGSTRLVGARIDCGAYEFQGTAPSAPLNIVSLPQSISICTVSGGVSFAVTNATTPTNFIWQLNPGSGFVALSTGSIYSVAASGPVSTLTISPLSTNLNGYQFRFYVSGTTYTSAPVTLNVHLPMTLYVNSAATGNRSGTTWVNAFTDLQSAIAAADSCAEIWVARGTYSTGGQPYRMKAGLPIYGGFAGTETALSQRNWTANRTVLQNSGTTSVIENIGLYGAIDGTAILDGFVIQGNNSAPAVYNFQSSPTIRNCTFENNVNSAIWSQLAGGSISNCVFTNGLETAIFVRGASPQISNCRFSTNNSSYTAGAMVMDGGASPTVQDCVFENNHGAEVGAISISDASSPIISRCMFATNSGGSQGALVDSGTGSPLIVNCAFMGNRSGNQAGAIGHFHSSMEILNCTIANNYAAYSGGGIENGTDGSLQILNTILWGNINGVTQPNATAESVQIGNLGGLVVVSNSCVQGLSAYAGSGNIGYDPLFANASTLALNASSPAVNTGNRAFVAGITSDLANAQRVFGTSVDIGAYELQSAPGPVAQILTQPSSQTVCRGDTATFSLTGGSSTVAAFHWQVDRGSGFVDLTSNSTNVIAVTGNATTLTILNANASAYRYRLTAPTLSYTTQPVTLSVNLPRTLYVNAGATGANNGTNWANAFTNLQSALAVVTTGCADVWVAKGTYTPTAAADGSTVFRLQSRVAIYGGFAGNETSLSQRDWTNNPTILTPDGSQAAVEAVGLYAAADGSAVLDGFTLSGSPVNALFIYNTSPTIRNCTFKGNANGIWNEVYASPTIVGCVFTNNTAGALVNRNGSTPIVQGCLFVNNTAQVSGGAIQNLASSHPTISSCTFSGNHSDGDGGAIDLSDGSVATISNCTFADNNAGEAGAISAIDSPGTTVANCLFVGNNSNHRGGAILTFRTILSLINCTITENNAVHWGGGVYVSGTTSIQNSILWANTDGDGFGTVQTQQLYPFSSADVVTLQNSCVQGLTTTTNGSFGFDPLFANTAVRDYHLTSYSPAVNAGDNSVIAAFTTDLDGNPRVFESTADLGAFEYQSAAAATPVRVTAFPKPFISCSSLAQATFSVLGATNAGDYQWQVDAGSGFVDITPNSTYSIVVTSNSTVLNASVTPSMNGYRYRVALSGTSVTSPPALLTVTSPNIIYVKRDATGTTDGSSWANAYTNLNSALSAASGCSEIWVAKGTYVAQADNDFQMKPGLPIFGGFAGTETTRLQRNVTNNPTLLMNSGSFAVINNIGWLIDSTALLDGFVITSINNAPGINNLFSTPTIQNCSFSGNVGYAIWNQLSTGGLISNCVFTNGSSGGIYNASATPTITGCLFVNNQTVTTGGGIANDDASPLIEDCIFDGNHAAQDAAISCSGVSSPMVSRCVFKNNIGQSGGSFGDYGSGSPTLANCLFYNNKSMHLAGAIGHDRSLLKVVNCTIADNQSQRGGGGIYNYGGTLQLLNSIVWNNANIEVYPGTTIEAIEIENHGTVLASNSCIQGLAAFAGNNNIQYDPLFQDTAAGNFALDATSPAVNGGSNAFAVGSVDLQKLSRTFDTAVDMGAYENQSVQTNVVRLLDAPTSLTACGGSSAQFSVVVAPGSTNTFTWQADTGSGFVDVSADSNHQINTSGNSSVLTIVDATGLDGSRYRAVAAGTSFATPAATLSVHQPQTVYVNAAATGANNGTSWANAFTSLQQALQSISDCAQIWVARGTYIPTASINSSVSFTMKSGATVYGGFAGTETSVNQRNWTNNPTILAPANANDAIVYNFGVDGAIDHSAVLDGFIVAGAGKIAIDNYYASPTVRNCTFTNNGYAVWNDYYSGADIESCSFVGNSEGGVYTRFSSSATISDCTFLNNHSHIDGGAVQATDSSQNVIIRCVFRNNTAYGYGGAVSFDYGSYGSVTESLFTGNSSGGGGGAIWSGQSSPVLRNLVIYGNSSFRGGGIAHQSTNTISITHCTIADNMATNGFGGVFGYGGLCAVENSILWNNNDQAYYSTTEQKQVGGFTGSSFVISNSTVQGLTAYVGNSNLLTDPLFTSEDTGDYSLPSYSPAVNTGSATLALGIATDYAGNPRVFGSAPDMGAYELQSAATAPVALVSSPHSTATCLGQNAQFTATGTDSGFAVSWQVNDGSGFVDVPVNATYSVMTNGGSSTLTVNSVTAGMDNFKYRFVASGGSFTSAPVTLNVSQPSVLYVNVAATGSNDGSSWASAFTNLQDAINVGGHCAELWVAKGTYIPSTLVDGSLAFRMKSTVAIYGGFAGNETSRNQRDWTANPTVLTTTNTVLFDNLGLGVPIDPSAILDGVVVSNAATQIAIDNNTASPTIRNCVFTGNASDAIYNFNSAPLITDCVFTNNSETAIVNRTSSTTIKACVFVANKMSEHGPIANDNCNPLIDSCMFTNNAAGFGGAIINENSASPTITHCVFDGNSSGNGGALYVGVNCNPIVRNCLFYRNSTSFRGGAIVNYGNTLGLVNCTLVANTAALSGGAIYNQSATSQIKNCIFWNNSSTPAYEVASIEGQQIDNYQGTVNATYSTIQGLSNYVATGNSGYDPLFANASAGNFTLGNYSPAINTGDNTALPLPDVDLLGNTRQFGTTVDMGAYEVQTASSGVLHLLSSPVSQSTCVDSTATLTVATSPTDNYFVQWQEFNGSAFTNITAGGNIAIGTTTNGSTLAISNLVLADSGTFRYVITNLSYISTPVTLQVTPREIIYVNFAATGSNDGMSWANALTSLPQAAAQAGGCSEIWVAAGTYVLTNYTDSNLAFTMKSGLAMYGGFAGSETSRAQRDWQVNATILRGPTNRAVIENIGLYAPIDNTAVLDGFTLSGCSDIAMYNLVANPTIQNCVFENNGRGVWNSSSSPNFANCTFRNNTNSAFVSVASTPIVTGSLFVSNGTPQVGAAVNARDGAGQFVDCSFLGNLSSSGGSAMYLENMSGVSVSRCVFKQNSSFGAAVVTVSSTATISDSLFARNASTSAAAAVSQTLSHLTINNCTITENTAHYDGVGIEAYGGSVNIANSILWNNSGANLFQATVEQQQIFNSQQLPAVIAVSYSCVQGLNTYRNASNIGYDPLFKAPQSDDFTLQAPFSPAIDAGNSALASAMDLNRSNRVSGASVDLGAFEAQNVGTATPVRLTSIPDSQTTCPRGNVAFTAGGQSNVNWKIDIGNGFEDVPNDGFHFVAISDTSSTLFVTNVVPTMDGYRYRFTVGNNYTSTPVSLIVAPRTIVYVNASATGNQSGADWANAYNNLQPAVRNADVCSEIWVAAGTYTPTIVNGDDYVIMKSGLEIYGGFAGTETNRNQRDWSANPVVLMGNTNTSLIVNDGSFSDIDRTAVLDGFVFEGFADASGLENVEASPTIRNCKFENHTSFAAINYGGAPLFESCVFTNNTGVGVECRDSSSALITNCVFAGTIPSPFSHAVNNTDSTPSIYNTLFDRNTTSVGGAAVNNEGGSCVIVGCTFRNNAAISSTDGGALVNISGATLLVTNCVFTGNSARIGGAIRNEGTLWLVNSTVFQNTAAMEGSGLELDFTGVAEVHNSIFWNNSETANSHAYNDPERSQIYNDGATLHISHSIVQYLNTYTGNGNLGYDPLLADPDSGDFSLNPGSPAINGGDNQFVTGLVVDRTGDARVQLGTVDIGAQEASSSQTAVLLTASPASLTTCLGSAGTFTVASATFSGTNFQWEFDAGSGWMPFVGSSGTSTGPQEGSYTIEVSSNSSTLVAMNITPNMDGYKFRYTVPGVVTGAPCVLHLPAAETIYVNASAAPGGDGRTWLTAYNDLQTALAAQQSCRRFIWVAAGTYSPGNTSGDVFNIPPGTAIYGGFIGNEIRVAQRNPQANQTILTGLSGNNTYVVEFDGTFVAIGTNTVLDGVVVQSAQQAGVFLNHASPTIQNCIIANNAMGMEIVGSSPAVLNSTITANTNQYGGGVYVVQNSGYVSQPLFQNCIISNNRNSNGGAGIYNSEGSVRVVNSLLFGNYSTGSGGAIFTLDGGNATVINSTITGNTGFDGAAIGGILANVVVRNSILWNNTALYSGASEERAEVYNNSGTNDFAYSCVQGLSTLTGTNNTANDPLFVNPAVNDLHLQPCSPLIDAGDNFSVASTTDFDGVPRVANAIVDIGAFESQSSATPLIITAQPVSVTYCGAATNQFLVTATGAGLTYQWEVDRNDGLGFVAVADNTSFTGSSTAALTIQNAQADLNQSRYRCGVSSAEGCSVNSKIATLTVKPQRLYVNASAAPGGNGSAWTYAYQTVQAALSNPALDPCGTEIWIAGGSYSIPSELQVLSRVSVYGGFAGNETAINQRNFQAHPAVLNGGASYVFVIDGSVSPIGSETILDGLTIRTAQSAGILINRASPTVRNCTLANNSGTGITVNNDSSPVVDGCSFLSNNGSFGAGLWLTGGNPIVRNCVFRGNTASSAGGAIFNQGATAQFINCLISGNSAAGSGGGVGAAAATPMTFINCTIVGNTAGFTSGGIADSGNTNLSVQNTILWHNSVGGTDDEFTQITKQSGTKVISDCVIDGLQTLTGNGNIGNDPLFVADIAVGSAPSVAGDFHLSSCSPAIDAGNDSFVAIASDLDRAPRNNGTVDIGAYEFQSTASTPLVITSQPASFTFCSTGDNIFSIVAAGDQLSYQWQINRNDGSGFVSLANDSVFSGATTTNLSIATANADFNGTQYRCIITSSGGCSATSQSGTLTYTSARWYVNASASAGGDGLSWATAFNTLPPAMTVSFAPCGNEIWVAQGTYTPGNQPMSLTNGVAIYGGFIGTETNLNQRDWNAHPTILTTQGTSANNIFNSYAQYYGGGYYTVIGASARLDGFILQGAPTAMTIGPSVGGLPDIAPTIANCTFRSNHLGINIQYARPLLFNCNFIATVMAPEMAAVFTSTLRVTTSRSRIAPSAETPRNTVVVFPLIMEPRRSLTASSAATPPARAAAGLSVRVYCTTAPLSAIMPTGLVPVPTGRPLR